MANTLSDLKALIADDINRTDLTTQIANEITDAISYWQSQRFWFNESRRIDFSTVSTQEWYGASATATIANLLDIDWVRLTNSSGRYKLDMRTADELEGMIVDPNLTGQPRWVAYYGQEFRFYPIPDQSYAITLGALYRLPALSGDSDSNAWITSADARDLIRFYVEWRLYTHVIKDADAAAAAQNGWQMALDRLNAETMRRASTGKVVATDF